MVSRPDFERQVMYRAEYMDTPVDVVNLGVADGEAQLIFPVDGRSLGVPPDTAEHCLRNGLSQAQFDIALVRHDHTRIEQVVNTRFSDAEWRDLQPFLAGRFRELVSEGDILHDMFENSLGLLERAVWEGNASIGAEDEVPAQVQTNYLQQVKYLSQALLSAADRSFDSGLVGVPLRSSSLVAETFTNHGQHSLLANFKRIPLWVNGRKMFASGIGSSRRELRSSIIDDLLGLDGRKFRITEICTSTGLTGISWLCLLKAYGVQPEDIEFVTPVASRQGVVNLLRTADELDMPLKILAVKAFNRVGNAWNTGEDAVKSDDNHPVIGDPPKIVGQELLMGRLAAIESAYARRHNINLI